MSAARRRKKAHRKARRNFEIHYRLASLWGNPLLTDHGEATVKELAEVEASFLPPRASRRRFR